MFFFQLNACSDLTTTNWVKTYGTEYQIGMFMCIKRQLEMPFFRKITNIVINNEQAFFLTCNTDTMYFDEHFYAYCVEEIGDSFSVLSVEQLLYY